MNLKVLLPFQIFAEKNGVRRICLHGPPVGSRDHGADRLVGGCADAVRGELENEDE